MNHFSPILEVSGIPLDLSIIIMIVVTSIVVMIIARLGVRNLSVDNPSKMQNFMEWLVEFVEGIIGTTMSMKIGQKFLKLGLTLIMFIFVANMLGLPLQFTTEHHDKPAYVSESKWNTEVEKAEAKGEEFHGEVSWWKSPTANAANTMALALMVIVIVHYQGMRHNTKHYWKHYIEPYPPFLPLNLIKVFSNPVSLGLRLYGNILAGEVMISVILGLGLFGIPALIVWQGFSIFVGSIQSFVFVMLTMVYMSQNLVHDEQH